ncbi:MAG: hypothetical protein ACMUIE_07860 [Thermoplasmatota archaeon]
MAGPEFRIGGMVEPTKGQSSRLYEEDHFELKAGWNSPVELQPPKDQLRWTVLLLAVLAGSLFLSGPILIITESNTYWKIVGFISITWGFVALFAIGAVFFSLRFRRARGAVLDTQDVDRDRMVKLVGEFLGSKKIPYRPVVENYLILKGIGYELPTMNIRLMAFKMKARKTPAGEILGEELKVTRFGIRNVAEDNYIMAVQLQMALDRFLGSMGIRGMPDHGRKVGYRWTGKTFESVYD